MRVTDTLRTKRGLAVVALLLAVVASGCGASEERDAAPAPTPGVAEPETPEISDAEIARPPPTAAALECVERAAAEDWSGALDPCTRALEENPGDPIVERALMQAKSKTTEATE